MQKIKLFLFILPIVLLAGCSVKQNNTQVVESFSEKNCLADECLVVENLEYPVADVNQTVEEALNEAIQDEYKAWSTYNKIIERFGKVRPFIMIIRAEEQHIASLKALFDKYGLEIPDNSWLDKAQVPESLSAACSIGVEAEITNANLYKNKLIPAVEDYLDIVQVFNNLMSASENKHLPAFEKCK